MKIKNLNKLLTIGVLLNSISFNSFAGVISEDGRYETFEGNSIKVEDILEEDMVDAEMEGNTLVNLIDYSKIDTHYYNYNSGYISEKNPDGRPWTNIEEVSSLKSNTYYTVIVENLNTADAVHIGFNRDWAKKIHDKITVFRTPDNIDYGFVFKVFGAQSNVRIMLLEGDIGNKDIPDYFEGLKSVGESESNNITLRSSDNLFDLNVYKVKQMVTHFNRVTGKIPLSEYSTTRSSLLPHDSIPVVPGSTMTCYSDKFQYSLAELDSEYNIIRETGWTSGKTVINLTENTHKIAFNFSNLDTYTNLNCKDVKQDDIILVYGDKDISSKNANEVTIPLKEPLRSLPNGVKDRIVKKNGQWMIERNCWGGTITGNERFVEGYSGWSNKVFGVPIDYPAKKDAHTVMWNSNVVQSRSVNELVYDDVTGLCIWEYLGFNVFIDVGKETIEETIAYIKNNPITYVYELAQPIYEPLNINLSANLYLDTTYISNNSAIPANIKVTVDRVMNRAVEYTELAKVNPTVKNLSNARYWNNLLKESIKKDQLQSEIDSMTNINDLQLERKSVTANVDLYIKSENMLSMSLDTNNITFEDFSGIEDMEKVNVVNVNINSSLPYQLNAYLPTEIQNGDKSNTINKDILNIKENSESAYQTFANTTDKIVLKDNCNSGNDLVHGIDVKLKGGIAHKKDIYKTTIKFEAEQK